MYRILSCLQGHQWKLQADLLPQGDSFLCPVCGSESQELTRQDTDSSVQESEEGNGSATWLPLPKIQGYEILEEIGRGGMGIVYKARQVQKDRIVALKIIRKDRLTNEQIVSRFRREAQAAARLSHPNVVQVYESDQKGDLHFLSMEYVPGITLQQLVDQRGPLPVSAACDYLQQSALGLQHAHEQALIHRDIKPGNLMLTEADGSARTVVKVLDMGVARLHQLKSQEESLTTLTQHGAVIGTPDYIAPEQLENPHDADIRADLYSLGCTAYFLLTGQVPFPGGTMIQKLDRQRWEIAPSVNQLRPEIPSAVALVVRRLMAKSPDDRYATPGDLAQALEQLKRSGYASVREPFLSKAPEHHWRGHEKTIHCLALLPDQDRLLSGGKDRSLRWWSLKDQKEIQRLDYPQEVTAIAVSPDQKQILIATGVTLRLLDAISGKEIQRFIGHADAVWSLAFFSDGKQILSAGNDRVVRIWDVHRGRVLERLQGHRSAVTGVALSSDDAWIVSGSRDQSLRVWEARRGREKRQFSVPRGAVLDVAFSADGKQIISAHFDTTIRYWDCESGQEARRFQGHHRMISAVQCLPGEKGLLSAGHDRTLRWWDPASGVERCVGEGHPGAITGLAISPNGNLIASGDAEGVLCLWHSP